VNSEKVYLEDDSSSNGNCSVNGEMNSRARLLGHNASWMAIDWIYDGHVGEWAS